MIEPKFNLFQMQQKGMVSHAFELLQVGLGKAPERFDAVTVRGSLHKFVLAMADAIMAVKVHVHQAIIAAPPVGVDHGRTINFTTYDGLQRLFRAIRNNFRIHLPAAFEQAKDNGFAARSPAPFAPYALRAK